MTKQTYRRRAGIIFGAVLGLVFGIVSQGVDPLLLPEVTLYQPPFGMGGNILLSLGVGTLLGLLCAWTEPSVPGITLASAVGSTLIVASAFLIGRTPIGMLPVTTIGMIFLWLPFTGMLFPVLSLVRVTVNRLTDYRQNPQTIPARWWLPVAVAIAAGALGWLLVYSPAARKVVNHNFLMIRQGLTASSMAMMPPPLIGPEMDDFSSRASRNFTLAWENKDLNAYAIPRSAGPEYLMSVVIARFDNGWNVVCLYPTADSEPRCRSFDTLP